MWVKIVNGMWGPLPKIVKKLGVLINWDKKKRNKCQLMGTKRIIYLILKIKLPVSNKLKH